MKVWLSITVLSMVVASALSLSAQGQTPADAAERRQTVTKPSKTLLTLAGGQRLRLVTTDGSVYPTCSWPEITQEGATFQVVPGGSDLGWSTEKEEMDVVICKIGDRKFRACHAGCGEAFKADRRSGLKYGLHKKPNGGFYQNREEASMVEGFCAYCSADVRMAKGVTVRKMA